MSNRNEILETVIQVINETLKPKNITISESLSLSKLKVDSIDKITIMLSLQEIYPNIDIEDDAIEKIKDISNIVDYIEQKAG